jgi:hypothetical protein
MKKKDWQTHDGQPVPESAISPFDKRKEPKMVAMVKKIETAIKARDIANDYMRKIGDALIKDLYASRGQEFTENDSYTLYNYDKSVRLTARKNCVLQLSSEVNVASKLFNDYLNEVLTTESADIRQLVQRAFSSKNGELDPKRLVMLLSMKIEHPKWKEAAEVLREAISTNNTKRYFKLAIRNSEGEYEEIW